MLAFLYVVIIVAVVAGIVGIINALAEHRVRGAKRAFRQVAIGEKSLRSIANGAGNPTLEAQIALDQISALYDSHYTKELN